MIGPLAPRRWAVALVATAGLALLPAPSPAWASEAACPTPEGYGTVEATLPKTAQALAKGSDVVIVTLGGSSTVGTAAGGGDLSWPSRLGVVLARRFPSARVKVVNLATPRQTARDAAGRLAREVLPLRPTLVIWETGTMEAVRGTDVDDFRETVQAVRVEGGVAANVVPDLVTVTINHRFAPDRTPDEAEAHLRDLLAPFLEDDDEVAVVDVANGSPPAVDHPVLRALIERNGLPVSAKLGWTDVARFAAHGIPAANFGPGDATLAHAPDERVERDRIDRCYAALHDLLSGGAGS